MLVVVDQMTSKILGIGKCLVAGGTFEVVSCVVSGHMVHQSVRVFVDGFVHSAIGLDVPWWRWWHNVNTRTSDTRSSRRCLNLGT